MTINLRRFTQAVYTFEAVARRVPDDKWDAPSACDEWTNRQLMGHQCGVLKGVGQVAVTGRMAAPDPPLEVPDPIGLWVETRTVLFDKLDVQGVLQQQGPFWFRTPTLDDMLGIVLWDPLTHAWDLAQGAGIEAAIDPELAAVALATIEPMSPMLVESGRTTEPVEIGPDDDVITRYLALVGRRA